MERSHSKSGQEGYGTRWHVITKYDVPYAVTNLPYIGSTHSVPYNTLLYHTPVAPAGRLRTLIFSSCLGSGLFPAKSTAPSPAHVVAVGRQPLLASICWAAFAFQPPPSSQGLLHLVDRFSLVVPQDVCQEEKKDEQSTLLEQG
jgi:hypothetical protein